LAAWSTPTFAEVGPVNHGQIIVWSYSDGLLHIATSVLLCSYNLI